MKLGQLNSLFHGSADTVLDLEDIEEELKHHHVVVTMGHCHITLDIGVGDNNHLILISTWGFSYEYIFSERIAMDLKSDLIFKLRVSNRGLFF